MFALGDKVIAQPGDRDVRRLRLVRAAPARRLRRPDARAGRRAGRARGGGRRSSSASARSPPRRPGSRSLAMALVGFAVLFAGVVSSVLAGASISLLLAFILPVSLPGPARAIPDRLAGLGLAARRSLLAIVVLWPAPARDPLRAAAIAACRALAGRLRADAAWLLAGRRPDAAERDEAIERPTAAAAALQRTFFATPYRPTGLSTAARAIVRLVDEIGWLERDLLRSRRRTRAAPGPTRSPARSRRPPPTSLERGAELLDDPGRPRASPDARSPSCARHSTQLEQRRRCATALARARPSRGRRTASPAIVSALDPSFRAQELSLRRLPGRGNIDLAAAADRRSWLGRLLGRQPAGLPGTVAAAQRAGAGAPRARTRSGSTTACAARRASRLAVLVAEPDRRPALLLGRARDALGAALERPQHRPERRPRAASARPAGFVVGAALLALIGTNATVLWLLLPVAVLVAGFAPAAVSFAAGPGRLHGRARDPLQHHPAGRLARRAPAHRGRRARLRRQPRRRRSSSGRAAR